GFLLTATGAIEFMNLPAITPLKMDRTFTRGPGGVLNCCSKDVQAAIRQSTLIAQGVAQSTGGPFAVEGPGGRAYTVIVSPIRPSSLITGPRPGAAVFVIDPDLPMQRL